VERRPDIYTVALTSVLSRSLLNEFRWGLRRTSFYGWTPFHLGCCGGSSDTDINETAQNALATFPMINGYVLNMNAGLGIGSPIAPHGTGGTRGSQSPLWSFADTVSWSSGKHSFKGGVELIYANSDGWNTGNTDLYPRATLGQGSVAVTGISTGLIPGLNTNDVITAQDLLANLSGTVANVTQGFIINSPDATTFDDYTTTIRRTRDIHQNDWSLFFKDDWKVTNNFTLNLGMRYEKYGLPYVANGIAGRPKGGQAGLFGISGRDFSALWNPFASGGSLTEIELIGKNSPNPQLGPHKEDWNNFAPSVGFSWNVPWFGRTTVVRGGYGINYTGAATFLTYDTTTLAAIPGTDNLRTFTPSTYTDLTTVTLPLVPLSAPFAPIPLTDRTVNFHGYDDGRVTPYVQSFNFSIQHELARNLSIDVSYSGTKGTKLWAPIQLNEVNIFENGILAAFNTVRAGGESPLFNQLLANLNVPGIGTVNNTTLTGSEALRRFNTTNVMLANGAVADLADFINSNPAIGGARGQMLRNAGLPENFIVVNPQFATVGMHGNNDNSTYHSLITQVRKRMSHGVTAEFSYTWSKSLGNTAIPAGVGTDTTLTTRDPRNRSLQKGLESFDRRHTVSGFGAWDLPFGPNRLLLANTNSIVRRLVEGWQMSGIVNWNNGQPLGYTTTVRTLGRTSNLNTPDLVGNMPDNFGEVRVADGFVEFFPGLTTQRAALPNFGGNTTLPGRFTNQVVVDQSGNVILRNPEPGTTGNTAQRWFVGPGALRVDAALSKKIRIDESRTFSIRADAVGFLNRPIWGNPNVDINSNTFGRITSATGARTITVGARLDF
jgi:hypothetical protein